MEKEEQRIVPRVHPPFIFGTQLLNPSRPEIVAAPLANSLADGAHFTETAQHTLSVLENLQEHFDEVNKKEMEDNFLKFSFKADIQDMLESLRQNIEQTNELPKNITSDLEDTHRNTLIVIERLKANIDKVNNQGFEQNAEQVQRLILNAISDIDSYTFDRREALRKSNSRIIGAKPDLDHYTRRSFTHLNWPFDFDSKNAEQ